MTSQMDGLQSFYFLSNNLPGWLGQVDELSVYAAKKHTEFGEEYTRLLKCARPRKVKSPSIVSQRSGDRVSEQKERSPMASMSSQDRVEISPFEAGNKYLFANAREKAKNTGCSVRSGNSGPRRFRNKHAVVIYYDSHIQTTLENMVKSLATARNNLRKGKKARDLTKGSMFPSFNSFVSTVPDFKRSNCGATINIDPKLNAAIATPEVTVMIDKCFEVADKDLEQAQNFCETAAHQFLRDGDISVEMKTVKEKFEKVIKLAKETAERIEKEEQEQKDLEELDTAVDESSDFRFELHPPFAKENLVPKDDHLAAIEVDSDDGEPDMMDTDLEKEFDINRFRTQTRTNVLRI